MRQAKIFICISALIAASLACNAVTGIRIAQTELPAMMTSAPTLMAPLETAAAELTPSASGNQSASAGGLGIKLDDVKTVLEGSQQFILSDGTVDGKQAVIASLSETAATTIPGLSSDFSAAFIGDPQNLEEIKITIPATNDKDSIKAGMSVMTLFFSTILPPDILIKFLSWIAKNISQIDVGSSQELTERNFHFILTRPESSVILDIIPAQ